MLKKLLLVILFIVSGIYLWVRTPISSNYYIGKAKRLYQLGQYDQAAEKIKMVSPNNREGRMLYVQILSKQGNGYSVQKKLYEIANSDIDDNAKSEAKKLVIEMKHKLLKGVEDNYIYNAVSGKDVIRWDMQKFPITYYIDEIATIPPYYIENINKAFDFWRKRSGFLKFAKISNKKFANIIVEFKDYQSSECSEEGCLYMAAYTKPAIKSDNVLDRMNLVFHKTSPNGRNFSPLEVYNTALHEIGHTLGLMGHSDNSSDIMYPNNERLNDLYAAYRTEYQYISMRDLKTLALLYRLKPTVSNTKNLENENFYYPPLILGNDGEVLERKKVELEKYIKEYPKFAAGYINIAPVYSDLGDFENALKALNKAESLAKTSDELYLIEYNRAILHYNKHDFSSAMTYATKARGIKQTSEVEELLNEIKKLIAVP